MEKTEKEKQEKLWWSHLGGYDYLVKYGGYATVEEYYPYALDQIDEWKEMKEKELGRKITIESGPDILFEGRSIVGISTDSNKMKIRYSYWRDGEENA